MTSVIDAINIGNTIYHAAVWTGFTVGYGIAAKKVLKYDIGDPSKADINEAVNPFAAESHFFAGTAQC
jgi:hypothetical protein